MSNETRVDAEIVLAALERLVGQYVWGVEVSDWRILHLEFGSPYLRVHELPARKSEVDGRVVPARRLVKATGQWSLFVESGSWSVKAGGLDCRRSLLGNERELACLADLSGQRLVDVSMGSGSTTLRMSFDLAGELTIDLHPDDDMTDQWMLFTCGEGTVSCRGNSEFVMEMPAQTTDPMPVTP